MVVGASSYWCCGWCWRYSGTRFCVKCSVSGCCCYSSDGDGVDVDATKAAVRPQGYLGVAVRGRLPLLLLWYWLFHVRLLLVLVLVLPRKRPSNLTDI